MESLNLEPDDVLTGAGTYRETVETRCPECGEPVEVDTLEDSHDCDACGKEIDVHNPFA
ncbi:MAG: hypothetical protein ACOCT0_05925 [Halobacteriota archaeon]